MYTTYTHDAYMIGVLNMELVCLFRRIVMETSWDASSPASQPPGGGGLQPDELTARCCLDACVEARLESVYERGREGEQQGSVREVERVCERPSVREGEGAGEGARARANGLVV